MKFRTTIVLGGKTATGFRVPDETVAALGSGKKPRVYVRIGGYTYRSTVAVYGGEYMLPLNADNRARAGVKAGDEVEVDVSLDNDPREVSVPDDLAAMLTAEPAAARAFESLSYSKQREHVSSVEAARTAQTRERRLAKTMDDLRGT